MAMEQQVNLYQPILGAERRLFSARAIVIALCVMAVGLVVFSGYASRRIGRLEVTIESIEKREAATLAMTESATQTFKPKMSQAALDAEAKRLTTDIESRQRALDVIGHGGETPATGFAARLAALGDRQIDGIWLSAISLKAGDGGLAMRGAALRPALVPTYLRGLAEEAALTGIRFDKLAMHHASAAEQPAQVVFELDSPGLKPEPAPKSEDAR
jgi:hypothetical protein